MTSFTYFNIILSTVVENESYEIMRVPDGRNKGTSVALQVESTLHPGVAKLSRRLSTHRIAARGALAGIKTK